MTSVLVLLYHCRDCAADWNPALAYATEPADAPDEPAVLVEVEEDDEHDPAGSRCPRCESFNCKAIDTRELTADELEAEGLTRGAGIEADADMPRCPLAAGPCDPDCGWWFEHEHNDSGTCSVLMLAQGIAYQTELAVRFAPQAPPDDDIGPNSDLEHLQMFAGIVGGRVQGVIAENPGLAPRAQNLAATMLKGVETLQAQLDQLDGLESAAELAKSRQ